MVVSVETKKWIRHIRHRQAHRAHHLQVFLLRLARILIALAHQPVFRFLLAQAAVVLRLVFLTRLHLRHLVFHPSHLLRV